MKSAEDFIKEKRPQDFDDIPKWHFEDMEEYASEREAKWKELCEKQKELRQVVDYRFAEIGYSPSNMNVALRQRIAELENELL